ncbi:MAG: metallophosphoesterase [Myxococcota bacterium]|nr:metallophosphoesterase [Myxococcota bacterium]
MRSIRPLQLVALYVLAALLLYLFDGELVRPRRVSAFPVIQKKESLSLILLGDMGQPGPQRERVLEQVRREEKDYVVALGDLIYPHPPPCKNGSPSPRDLPFYQKSVAGGLKALGAPVLAVLGNHSYYQGSIRGLVYLPYPWLPTPRERGADQRGRVLSPAACVVDFLSTLPHVYLPALDYNVDLGVAQIAFVDTNHLDGEAATVVKEGFSRGTGWKLLFGHHVLKTYHDKTRENLVRPWLREHRIKPDLYANGHAHLLQLGIYDGIPAVTSGTGSKLRRRPSCPPKCGAGQRWGVSQFGYARLEVSADALALSFKNSSGETLHRWRRQKGEPLSGERAR